MTNQVDPSVTRPPSTGTSVVVIHEDHLGHRTYAENLRMAAADLADIDAAWVPVRYEAALPFPLDRLPLPAGVRSPLVGRHEVLAGLRAHSDAAVRVYNTQVPAALGGRRARRSPYIAITDVTPLQYDRMAAGYGHRADAGGLVSGWKHRVNERVFRDATWCVGWSNWVADSLVEEYGVDPDRVAVIPPGVDTERWRPPADPVRSGNRILFVGGELERKGGDLLIASLDRLPDVELHLVTRSAVAPHDRVHVYDDLVPNDPRLLDLFRTSDVFAMPSRAETFGIAVAEASAAGLPVVASGVGGLPDIVSDGESGFVVPVDDLEALVEALARLLDDDALRAEMGAAARARAVERFDAATNAGRLFELVRAAAGRSGGSLGSRR